MAIVETSDHDTSRSSSSARLASRGRANAAVKEPSGAQSGGALRDGYVEQTLEVTYTVGEVAQKVGFSAASLRLWERQGLVSPRRTASGYRIFTEDDVKILRRIAHLRNVERLNSAAIRRVIKANASDAPPPQQSGVPLGPRLRKLRQDRRLTLEQVSAEISLSVSFLSSLERGQTGVSVATLTRLLSFYGTTVATLLGGTRGGKGGRLTRAGRRPRIAERFSKVIIEQLATGHIQMEPQIFVVEPGGGSEGGYSHDGEEFIYVLEGTLEVFLEGGERYRLRVGDCLYFTSTTEHSWRNPGRSVARLLWVNTPPTF